MGRESAYPSHTLAVATVPKVILVGGVGGMRRPSPWTPAGEEGRYGGTGAKQDEDSEEEAACCDQRGN